MADDLGDSHPLSLQQGGRLPDNSIEARTVGKVFVQATQPVNYFIFKEEQVSSITLDLYRDTSRVHSDVSSANFNGTYTPDFTGW